MKKAKNNKPTPPPVPEPEERLDDDDDDDDLMEQEPAPAASSKRPLESNGKADSKSNKGAKTAMKNHPKDGDDNEDEKDATDKSSAIVRAPSSGVDAANFQAAEQRRQAMFKPRRLTQPDRVSTTNKAANYVRVRGYIASRTDVTQGGKTPGSKAFPVVKMCILRQEVRRTSVGSLIYPGTVNDPSSAFAVPSKTVPRSAEEKAASKTPLPEYRHPPENPRTVPLQVIEVSYIKNKTGAEAEKESEILDKCVAGAYIECDVEYKIKDTAHPLTDAVNCNIVGKEIVILKPANKGPDQESDFVTAVCNDNQINAISYDTYLDSCGGVLPAIFGTNALSVADELNKEEEVAENAARNEALMEYPIRVSKRPTELGGALMTIQQTFQGEHSDAAQSFKAKAESLMEQASPDNPGDVPSIRDLLPYGQHNTDRPKMVITCSRMERIYNLLREPGNVKRFLEAQPSAVEANTSANGNWFSCQVAFNMCHNSGIVHEKMQTTTDQYKTGLLTTTDSLDMQGKPEVRLTLKSDLGRIAGVFSIRSVPHLNAFIKQFWFDAKWFADVSISPLNISESDGTLGGAFINSLNVDVPDLLRYRGIPVSEEWVQRNLCEGSPQFPGLEHVTDANVTDHDKYIKMIGSHKTEVTAAAVMTRGFINLTEYVGKKPWRNIPPNRVPRHVVMIALDDVEDWYNEIRSENHLTNDKMIDDGTGEKFLYELFEKYKGDETNMEEFLIAKNATVFGVLEAEQASTSLMIK